MQKIFDTKQLSLKFAKSRISKMDLNHSSYKERRNESKYSNFIN